MSASTKERPPALRRLGPDDAAIYRELRLIGLKECPEAFAASFEDEAERPIAWFSERLQSSFVFGSFADETRLGGVAGLRPHSAAKLAHIGVLWGMYVAPVARGRGIGAALVRRMIEEAANRVEQVHLSVVATNEAAIGLYAKAGFKQYGLEKRALKVGGRYYDEILMALDIDPR